MEDDIVLYGSCAILLLVILLYGIRSIRFAILNFAIFLLYSAILHYNLFYNGKGGSGLLWFFLLLLIIWLHLLLFIAYLLFKYLKRKT